MLWFGCSDVLDRWGRGDEEEVDKDGWTESFALDRWICRVMDFMTKYEFNVVLHPWSGVGETDLLMALTRLHVNYPLFAQVRVLTSATEKMYDTVYEMLECLVFG